MKPIPTVEQLVEVFRANNWKPKMGTDGARLENIERGYCCAIPAVVLLEDKDFISKMKSEGLNPYSEIERLHGEHSLMIWKGFDGYFSREVDGIDPWPRRYTQEQIAWTTLGANLWTALNQEK